MNVKKYLPHLIAIAAFMAVSLFYFSPLLDGKKQIQQSDISQFKGSAQEIADFRKDHNGEEPIWTNSMFGGMPAYQISVQYHNNLMRYVDQLFQLWLPFPVGYVFLYFIGFYILLMCLKVNPWIAIVGSLAYGFSSFFFIVLEVGHNTQAHAIGYAAPFLGGVILLLRGNKILGTALTTLFASLELYCNHVQITYYFFMIILAVLILEFYTAIKEKRIPDFFKRSILIGAAVLIAVLPNVTNLWTTYEYGKYTTRGTSDLTINAEGQKDASNKTGGLDRDYATMWSYGIGETFTLLIPNFKGGASERLSSNKGAMEAVKDPQMREYSGSMMSYYGNQMVTSGPVYVGAIMIFLAVLGMFLIKDRIKWALLIITIITIMLSWGKNLMWFTNIFFDYFPGYNKFRSITMILVVAELTIPLLAVLALQRIFESSGSAEVTVGKRKMNINRLLYISAGVTGGFALLCYLSPDSFTSFSADNELKQIVSQVQQQQPNVNPAQIESMYAPVLEQAEVARKALFRSDAIRTVIFILLAMGALWFYTAKKINQQLLAVALGIFVLADMWPVASRYLSSKNYVTKKQMETTFQKTKADELILEDKSPDYRVLNLARNTFNDATTSYWHKSLGGYHGAKLKRYKELIDFHIDKDMAKLMQGLRSAGVTDSSVRAAFNKTQILNMLNTKYVIIQEDAPPLVNKATNGNAWFVREALMVNTADEEILKLGQINTKETAIINNKFKGDMGTIDSKLDTSATIKLNSYQANKLVYESSSTTNQLAVFSEIYYPKGWIATIDGKESPIVNADYVLRAIVIPAGKHTVEFSFKPAAYYTGEKIALAGSLLVLVIGFGGIFFAFKKQKTV